VQGQCSYGGAKFELGCGDRKVEPDSIGIDALALPGVDIVGDIYEILELVPSYAAKRIYSSHFLEHVEDLPRLMAEAARILEPGGEFIAVVPHFSNPFFYSDPTHRVFFGIYSFSYLVEDRLFDRKVPQYSNPLPFTLEHVHLRCKAKKRFPIRRLINPVVEKIANRNHWWIELYEESFSSILPCFEIRFELRLEPADSDG